ncbi:MAG: family N-acetyltransferase [Segetibacter sp.]|nr:family N-acetyltransferase [Segetibacter sp.]
MNIKEEHPNTMTKVAVTLRPMELNDIGEAMKLSTAEGWNQTENDWRVLIENPENVCLLAESDKKVIGTTTAINYSNDVAWIGMVLVNREYRGLGVAKSLLTAIFKKVESCKSVKLDATPAGQQVYHQLRFKDEYLIARMTNLSMKDLPPVNEDSVAEPIRLQHLPEIVALDAFIFGAKRQQLIEYLLKQCQGKGWLLKRDNKVVGFTLGRDGNKYHHIGPVVAETTLDAKILISKALASLNDQPVVVDVLHDKEELINWLNSIGFIEQRHFIRMYKDENPFPGEIDKQYLICGPEFG